MSQGKMCARGQDSNLQWVAMLLLGEITAFYSNFLSIQASNYSYVGKVIMPFYPPAVSPTLGASISNGKSPPIPRYPPYPYSLTNSATSGLTYWNHSTIMSFHVLPLAIHSMFDLLTLNILAITWSNPFSGKYP